MKHISQVWNWFKDIFASIRTKSGIHPLPQLKTNTNKEESTSLISSIGTMTVGQITLFRFIGVCVTYVGYLMFQSLQLLYLILAAVLVSVAMESLIMIGQKWMPRGWSIALSYILLSLFAITGVVIILPFVLNQISTIITIVISYFYTMGTKINMLGLTGYVESLSWMPTFIKSSLLNTLQHDTMNIQATLIDNISTLVAKGTDYAQNVGGVALRFVGSFFSMLGQVGLILTIAVLFSLEKDSIIRFFIYYTVRDNKQIQYMSQKIDLFYRKMGFWLTAQLGLCFYIGIIVYISLQILSLCGMPLTDIGSLALMAGFTEFIPYIGPLLGAVPAVILATSIYGIKGLVIVSILYFIIQWIENNVLIPLLMNKSLGVSPLLIFLCVLIGGSVLGFIGILLAVPLSVIVTMLVKKDFE